MQVSARRRKPWQHSSLEVEISAVPCRRMLAGLKMSMQLCCAFNAQHLCSVFFHAKKRPTDHVSINHTLKCTNFSHLYSMSLSGLSFLCCSCLIDNAVLTLTKALVQPSSDSVGSSQVLCTQAYHLKQGGGGSALSNRLHCNARNKLLGVGLTGVSFSCRLIRG